MYSLYVTLLLHIFQDFMNKAKLVCKCCMCPSSKKHWRFRIFNSQYAAASPFPERVYALPVYLRFPLTPNEGKTPKSNGDCAIRALEMVFKLIGVYHCDSVHERKGYTAISQELTQQQSRHNH